MVSNEQRRERYHNDEEYRTKTLKRFKDKYDTDKEYRDRKIKQAITYDKDHIDDVKQYRKQYYIVVPLRD